MNSATWQRTLFFENDGQPAHRAAWSDEEVNRRSHGFFRDTLATLDDSWGRPRHSGYLHFQDHGGDVVRDFLTGKADTAATLADLDRLYRHSLSLAPS